ncbi:MAG: baseplate J/gp47 family protein [Acidaminococcaceae bacterium]|nr:baseplate J/gp47 family protein [Acidaminococcaceae bacterium]MBQ9634692.1 baseplate J/gp47 family protein [Acidaminococcaceae bacterium]
MSIKTVETILQEMLDAVSNTYQKTEGFPTWDLLKAAALGLKKLWDKAFEVEKLLNVDNLEGTVLERFVYQRKGLTRKAATYAKGYITILTGDGTINKGDLFSTSGNVQFMSTETKEVTAGSVVAVQAVISGAAGNVAAETITEMPVTLAGIAKVINMEAMEGGYEAETDNSFRKRYYEVLREPATSGNIYHYKQWAKEISGVGEAKVFPLWQGDNTVQVIIVDSDGLVPGHDLINQVQEYIDPGQGGTGEGAAPIGAYCTVTAATPLNIIVSADIILRGAAELETVRQAIAINIAAYLKEIAFKSSWVSVGKIGDVLINTEGVEDYNNLIVNGGTVRVAIPEKSVAVLSEVDVNDITE